MTMALLDRASQPVRNYMVESVGSAAGQWGGLTSVRSDSTVWTARGVGTSHLITPNGVSNDSAMAISGGVETIRINLGLQPGKKYTVVGTLYLPQVQTGSLSSRARRIVVWHGTDGYTEYQGTQPPNVVGVYRIANTFTLSTAANRFFVRFYNGSINASDVCYWDDLMIVEGDDPGEYLDGNSPNWRWTGTPGASESVGYLIRPVTNLDTSPKPSVQAGTRSRVVWDGTSVTRMIVTDATPGTGVGDQMPPQRTLRIQDLSRFSSYFCRVEMRGNAPIGRLLMRFGADAATQVYKDLPLDPVEWKTFTVVLPAAPATVSNSVNLAIGLAQASGQALDQWFEYRYLMWKEGAEPVDYYDGDSPDWRWLGTAGNSASTGYLRPGPIAVPGLVRNLALTPNGGSANTSGIGTTVGTVTANSPEQYRSGAGSLKLEGSTGRKWLIPNNIIREGVPISWSIWLYPLAAITVNPYWERSGGGGFGQGGTQTLPANTWSRFTGTLTPTSAQANGGVTSGVGFGFLGGSPSPTSATTVYCDDVMIVEGPLSSLPEAYADGDTPGWRWTGATGASVSVGYPYTLESIAGTLLFDVSVPNVTTVLDPAAYNPVINGITMLSVINRITQPGASVVATASQYGKIGFTEDTPSSNFHSRLIGNAAGTNVNAQTRLTAGGGPNLSGATGVGPLVIASGILPGAGTVFVGHSQTTSFGNTSTYDLSAITHDSVKVNPNTAYHNIIRVVGIRASDPSVVLRAMAWLARKYGAPIPAGY